MADFIISIPELGQKAQRNFTGTLEQARNEMGDLVRHSGCEYKSEIRPGQSFYTWEADVIVPAKPEHTWPAKMGFPWGHLVAHALSRGCRRIADCPIRIRTEVNARISNQLAIVSNPTPGTVLLTHLYDLSGFVTPRPPDWDVAAAWCEAIKDRPLLVGQPVQLSGYPDNFPLLNSSWRTLCKRFIGERVTGQIESFLDSDRTIYSVKFDQGVFQVSRANLVPVPWSQDSRDPRLQVQVDPRTSLVNFYCPVHGTTRSVDPDDPTKRGEPAWADCPKCLEEGMPIKRIIVGDVGPVK